MQKSRVASRRDGNVAIEFGIILPVLLLLTFGIIDFGRLLGAKTSLTRATQATARCAALNFCPDENGVPISPEAYAAKNAWATHGITSSAFTVTTDACGVKVTATYDFQFVIPGFGGSPLGTVTLNESACYAAQQ